MTDKTSLSYRDAGVDIDAGNELVDRIKPAVARTMRPEVLTGLGGFVALFQLDLKRWREPLPLCSSWGCRLAAAHHEVHSRSLTTSPRMSRTSPAVSGRS